MGDDHFRTNVTDFIPSVQDKNGLQFDMFVPRVTISGPIKKGKAWFYDGVESEYDNIVISELPSNADNDRLWRGSNLAKAQVKLTQANVLTAGLLLNGYHSPYNGISPLIPQQSTTDNNIVAADAYVMDQHSFGNRSVLDVGLALVRFRDGYTPARHHSVCHHAGRLIRKFLRNTRRACATRAGDGECLSSTKAIGWSALCESWPGVGSNQLRRKRNAAAGKLPA